MRPPSQISLIERKEALVIVNPTAHNAPKPAHLQKADEALRAAGWQAEWAETTKRGEAQALASAAADRRVPLLFVCGGDGTLNEAVNGLAHSETVLAVIPAGTVNLWAREVGLMKRPHDAVTLVMAGERRLIDLGKAGGRYFLLMASYGLDAAVANRVSASLKGRVGATAYAIAAAREALTYRGTPVKIRLDDEEHDIELLMLLAANTRSYAGLTTIAAHAQADDGLIDVCAFRGRGRWDIAWLALVTLFRQHRRSRKVLYRQVRRLQLLADVAVPVQIDGDAVPEASTEIVVSPDSLWVAVPQRVKSPIFRPVT